MTEFDTNDDAKVVPFPGAFCAPEEPAEPRSDSSVARARVAEEADMARTAELVAKALDTKDLAANEQRFLLSRNLRDYVYGLKKEKKLDPKDVARMARGGKRSATERSVRAMQEYVAPIGVDDYATYLAAEKPKHLAGGPANYKKLILAAAALAGEDPREALLALARGTIYRPGATALADDDRKYALQIATVLADLHGPLDAVMPLARYFETLERWRILPTTREGRTVFFKPEDFDGWDHLAMPSVPLAYRLLEGRDAILVIPPAGGFSDEQLDAIVAAGGSVAAKATRRCEFALAVSGFTGRSRPVGVFSHTVGIWADGIGHVGDADHDRFEGGWSRIAVKGDDGAPVAAAWRLADQTEFVGDEDCPEAPEIRPDIRIRTLTADFLLKTVERGWDAIRRPPGSRPFGWRYGLASATSRLGAEDSIAGLIERALLVSGEGRGLVAELTEKYESLAEAMNRWQQTEFGPVERKLDDLSAFLRKAAKRDGEGAA